MNEQEARKAPHEPMIDKEIELLAYFTGKSAVGQWDLRKRTGTEQLKRSTGN